MIDDKDVMVQWVAERVVEALNTHRSARLTAADTNSPFNATERLAAEDVEDMFFDIASRLGIDPVVFGERLRFDDYFEVEYNPAFLPLWPFWMLRDRFWPGRKPRPLTVAEFARTLAIEFAAELRSPKTDHDH